MTSALYAQRQVETPRTGRGVRVINGDVFDALAKLPDDYFDCVVTSPPYWGLRDYGVDGQLGLECSLGEHIDVMVRVFREVRRVLKPTGTLWLNYGDCYATAPNGRSAADTKAAGNDDRTFRDKPFSTIGPIVPPSPGNPFPPGIKRRGGGNNFSAELKPKDLCMIPNRLAIALQEDGWWVRSEIIWHKPNPMPESIKDRPGCSHEKVFLLSKSERYYYDHVAVRQPLAAASVARLAQNVSEQLGSDRAHAGGKTNGRTKAVKFGGNKGMGDHGSAARRASGNEWDSTLDGANLRNVWTIPTAAFSGAHFATFPPELVERCLKAGCPKGGHVLDPFGGSGTTALVADGLGMGCTLIELNPAYVEIARKRLSDMFRSIMVEAA